MIASLGASISVTSVSEQWRLFAAAIVVIALITLSLTRTLARLRRHRTASMLTSGGWLVIVVGIAIGPIGLRLVDSEAMLSAHPLVMVALTWIGVIVGLQARLGILRAIPVPIVRAVAGDAVLASLTVPIVVVLALPAFVTLVPPGQLPVLIAALVIAAIGWSPETRSLRLPRDDRAAATRVFIQASAGLGALVCVLAIGIVRPVTLVVGAEWSAAATALLPVIVAAALAASLAFGARVLLARVERYHPEMLVALFGILALLSGVADRLDVPPVFVGAVCGAVLANLGGAAIRDLEATLTRAEPALASIVSLIAGLMFSSEHLVVAALMAVGLVTYRLTIKPLAVGRSLAGFTAQRASTSPSSRNLKRFAGANITGITMRQAPVTLVLALVMRVEYRGAMDLVVTASVIALILGTVISPLVARRRLSGGTP